MPVLFTHEPVVNKSRSITANRLIVHGSSMDDACNALEAVASSWPTKHMIMLSLRGFPPDATLAEWGLTDNTLIELPAAFLAKPEGAELARKLAERGTGICISEISEGAVLPDGIPSRFGLIDLPTSPEAFGKAGLPLAVGLNDVDGFKQAMAAGFSGAAGWFFLHDKPQGRKPESAATNILHILNLVMDEADIGEIEAALKHDVSVSYNLLRYVNSAALGLSVEIQSFRQAVAMLGYKQLRKWLSLMLVKSSRNPESQALMQAAITRGRLMEVLGHEYFDKRECDNLFITGAFSLLDLLLETDLSALLDNMHLPDPIVDALLHGEGAYAPFLKLAIACENNPAQITKHAMELGVTAKALNRAALTALAYAEEMQAG